VSSAQCAPNALLISAVLAMLLGVTAGCGAAPRDAAADGPTAASARARALPPAVAARPAVEAQHSGETLQGRVTYRWGSEPDPIPFNERFALVVTVARGGLPGQALPGAQLEANALMPEHGHGMNTFPQVTRQEDGSFRVDGMLFHMPGLWHIVFVVKDGDLYDSALVPVTLE
jgi:hypothetical protein